MSAGEGRARAVPRRARRGEAETKRNIDRQYRNLSHQQLYLIPWRPVVHAVDESGAQRGTIVAGAVSAVERIAMHATDMAKGWLSPLLTLQSCLAWSNPMPRGRYPAKPGAGRFPCRGVVADEPVFERPRLDVGTPLWMCGCRPRRACRELMVGMLRQLGRRGWVSIAPCAAVDACVGSGRTPAQTEPGVGLLVLGLRRSRREAIDSVSGWWLRVAKVWTLHCAKLGMVSGAVAVGARVVWSRLKL
jgi:hypothetical protein